jgi:hypothetical protein
MPLRYSNVGGHREGVTAAAGKLQAAGLIHCQRGRITDLDCKKLEARTGECCQAVKTECDRLMTGGA